MSVTPYASLTQLKLHLGITDSSQDSLLNDLLSTTYYVINSLLDVDSFNQAATTEKFSLDDIRSRWEVLAKNYPVTSITHINGTVYSGALWTDYTIQLKRQLWIDNLWTYLNNLPFPFFTITYVAWYDRDNSWVDELPEDIKLLQLKLCTQEYNRMKTTWLSSYTLWDESMSFSAGALDDPMVKMILSKYKKANVI